MRPVLEAANISFLQDASFTTVRILWTREARRKVLLTLSPVSALVISRTVAVVSYLALR
jgi:hypothetical protein